VISFDSNALVVNAAVPVKTIQELLQYAKDNPGKLSSGATLGIGPHVSLELLRARTGSNMNFIPYRGAAPAITDLLGNQIQVGMSSKAVMLPLINAGKLRGLAVTSDDRWPELPDVPTLRESKFEGIPALLWSGLLAPAQTPTAVIDKLNAAMVEAMQTPAAQAGLTKLGLKTKALTAKEFDAVLAEETRIWEAAVKESNMKLD
jgi:tripartite-type tricarboxylate transporter receptor subunit TctC